LSGRIERFFERRWSYPAVYLLLVLLTLFGYPYASGGYAPWDIGRVISSLLSVSTLPYGWTAPVFHIATIVLIAAVWRYGARVSRVFTTYIGANYVFIAFAQMIGVTLEFGLVVLVGGLASYVLIGLLWFRDASAPRTETVFDRLPLWRYWPIPLAALAFWSPINMSLNELNTLQHLLEFLRLSSNLYVSLMIASQSPLLLISLQAASLLLTSYLMSPNFSPLLLLTSSGYGLTFCMTTPVFLSLLTLFYPKVSEPAYKITAFTGIIYGLLNMQSLLSPHTQWMGILHIPLLLISIYALTLPWILKEKPPSQQTIST